MKATIIVGHDQVRGELERAFAAGRLPQVLLITGERGVGKQSLGRWLANLLLCQRVADGRACGQCQGCRLVADLSHPDFHWFVPIPRPKAGDADKQLEEVKETLGELMAARRESPVYGAPDGMAMHGVGSARLLLKTGSLTTVMGGRRVFLVGDADRLVPQESSPEAANTLLKFLEEPPASTTIVLTAIDPTRVLPTIRSRSVQIRLGRLDPATVEAGIRVLRPDLPAAEVRDRAGRAEGSIGRALGQDSSETAGAQVEQLLAVIRQGGPARFERILKQGSFAARGDFATLLDGLAAALGSAARAAAEGRGAVPEPLRGVSPPSRYLAAIERVDLARESAAGNVNPQLLLATLTGEIAEALWA